MKLAYLLGSDWVSVPNPGMRQHLNLMTFKRSNDSEACEECLSTSFPPYIWTLASLAFANQEIFKPNYLCTEKIILLKLTFSQTNKDRLKRQSSYNHKTLTKTMLVGGRLSKQMEREAHPIPFYRTYATNVRNNPKDRGPGKGQGGK